MGTWRSLPDIARKRWCAAARDRVILSGHLPPSRPGRRIVIDGDVIDGRRGFYCALGEAINGPGGYFGMSLRAVEDCLYGGFGLEFPYTIVWRNSAQSRAVLDASALRECLHEEREPLDVEVHEEGGIPVDGRTLFDEILALLMCVSEQRDGALKVTLL
ncbi:MAG: barstar family protein [Myxococcota bacterium]